MTKSNAKSRNIYLKIAQSLMITASLSGWFGENTAWAAAPAEEPEHVATPARIVALVQRIEQGETFVREQPAYNQPNSIVVLGPTGNGKTTLISFLAGRQINRNGGTLDVGNPLPHFNVGHGYGAGTPHPTSWLDETPGRNVAWWDCPGFGDPGGNLMEVANAFNINQLLRRPNNTKIVLVVGERALDPENDRGTRFLNLLNRLTELFPNVDQLYRSLSLVITKHQTDGFLGGLAAYVQQNGGLLNQRGTLVLNFLVNHADPGGADCRVSYFPHPHLNLAYDYNAEVNRNVILNRILHTGYTANPTINLSIGHAATVFAQRLADSLNRSMVNFIRDRGTRGVVNFFKDRIDHHAGNVADLRVDIAAQLADLIQLRDIVANEAGVLDFANRLNAFFDAHTRVQSTLAATARHLQFLGRVGIQNHYNIGNWFGALGNVTGRIQRLTTAPAVTYAGGVLTLKGPLVGTSDINWLTYPEATRVDLYATNSLIWDVNITRPGMALRAFAPQWKVMGDIAINLSGAHGVDIAGAAATGTDGLPGRPGKNGGSFYGKAHVVQGAQNLTIRSHGGNGGRGQDGGAGAVGVAGRDGDLSKETNRLYPGEGKANYTGSGRAEWGYNRTVVNTIYYNDPGTDGTIGGAGGRAGSGGREGFAGRIALEGVDAAQLVHANGAVGANGAAGVGGLGGTHGRNAGGVLNYSKWYGDIGSPGHPVGGELPAVTAWTSPQAHVARNPVRAASGATPGGFNAGGQIIPAQDALLARDAWLAGYSVFYDQQAGLPDIVPFMKPFPGL